MASLADHLKKQSEQGASTYYNIDIIKYEVCTAAMFITLTLLAGKGIALEILTRIFPLGRVEVI